MRGRRAKERISERDFATVDRVSGVAEGARGVGSREKISIDNNAPRAEAQMGPAVGETENIVRRQLPGAEFLVVPKHIALRVALFSQQSVYQSDRFNRLTVINWPDMDAGLGFKILENRLCENLVLRCVHNHG